jgi:hypothetical protein
VPQPSDKPEPPNRQTPRTGRRTRFVLPADQHDERVGERIEAFLDGPRRTRRTRGRHLRNEALLRPRKPIPMDTRADWDLALRLEDARMARYGRPASVLIVSLELPVAGQEDRYAGRVGDAIRAHARETDRVARVGPGRFHVLLPETLESEATALADRVQGACLEVLTGGAADDLAIRAVAATPARGGTLADALRRAALRLAE